MTQGYNSISSIMDVIVEDMENAYQHALKQPTPLSVLFRLPLTEYEGRRKTDVGIVS